MLRKLRLVFKALKLVLATVLAAACVGYGLLFAFHLAPLVMLTGSMGKTIPSGSLVVDRVVSPSELKVGDVISFQKPVGSHGLDTHRIVGIERSQGHVLYQTKGDGNARPDEWAIQFTHGTKANRVLFSVPYLGWGLLYLREPLVRKLILLSVLLTVLSTFLKALALGGVTEKGREDDEITAQLPPPSTSTALAIRPPNALAIREATSTALVVAPPAQPAAAARWRPALSTALALTAFVVTMAVRSRVS